MPHKAITENVIASILSHWHCYDLGAKLFNRKLKLFCCKGSIQYVLPKKNKNLFGGK